MPDMNDFHAFKSTSGGSGGNGGEVGCGTWIVAILCILWLIGRIAT